MAQTIPNLFILGPPRSGTTSMSKWLSLHPDVTAGRQKEPMFHASDLPSPLRVDDLEEYLGLWAGAEASPVRLEASTWYLFSREAAKSIAHMSPSARMIVHLRDPVDLLASLHTHHVFRGMEDEVDFESAVFREGSADTDEFRRGIDYLDVVRLAGQISRYHEHFPKDRITFVDFEKIENDPEGAYLDLLDSLGLSRVRLDEYSQLNPGRRERVRGASQRFEGMRSVFGRRVGKVIRRLNISVGRPPVDKGVRRRILERITPDIDELAELIDRDLSHWKAI